jgi:hypothetical protein
MAETTTGGRVGAPLPRDLPIDHLGVYAQRAEQLGFDERSPPPRRRHDRRAHPDGDDRLQALESLTTALSV